MLEGTNYQLAMINPFTYRGYYHDFDTGLYFLKTRYYDPMTGRFISMDDVEYIDPETIGGVNLFAYCNNNPVMNADPSGNFLISSIGAHDYMDMKTKLKQKIKEGKKISIILGSIICVALGVLIAILFIDRFTKVKNGETETTTWVNLGIVVLLISWIVIFTKCILLMYISLKKDNDENYEEIHILVLRAKTGVNFLYGTGYSNAFVENIETGEQFWLEGCDMKENETYCVLRDKHTKQFVYEPATFEQSIEDRREKASKIDFNSKD